ncbi:MAG: response regulator transcription factor [Sphingobium sp.]
MAEPRFDKLTQRQKDCLRLVAQGYTSKEIGRALGISYSTVDNHLLAATQLLEADSRAEAARLFTLNDTDETRQQMPRQSQSLAPSAVSPDPVDKGTRGRWDKLSRLVPPIGGKENDLTKVQTLFAISRITFLSVLAFIACIMIIRMSIAALS